MKALTTHWGKFKETLNITYKTIVRPILEYASTIWSPIISNTNTNKLQTIQNSALRTITRCTLDTNVHHLHTETKILPIDTHMKLHGSQLRQQAQDPEHTLHRLTTQEPPARLKKQTIFHNNNYTTDIDTPPDTTTQETIKANTAQIHTQIIANYIQTIPHNKILNRTPPEISNTEQALPHSIQEDFLHNSAQTNHQSYTNIYTKSPQKHTQHQTVPFATHNYMTHNTYLAARGCRRTRALRRCGTIPGGGGEGGGAAGPLVGSAGVGPGAGMRRVGRPWGRQQQQLGIDLFLYWHSKLCSHRKHAMFLGYFWGRGAEERTKGISIGV